MKVQNQHQIKPETQSCQTSVVRSLFKGDCDKNIHWYAGVYSQGQWIYNECTYCKKRQEN